MKKTCPECKGTGLKMPLCDSDCPDCGGEGQVEVEPHKYDDHEYEWPDTEDGRQLQLLNDKDNLSDWEITFCNGVTDWVLKQDRSLTGKQLETIKKILRKR
jgi:hypothetical protein